MSSTHAFITNVAERAGRREIDALADFYGVGAIVVAGEISYDDARDQLCAEFKSRGLSPATAKTYLSQGHALAQRFPTFEALSDYSDAECNGSNSLKRLYDSLRDKTAEKSATAAPAKVVPTDADRANAILNILSAMTDAAAIASVRDAAAAMLVPATVAA